MITNMPEDYGIITDLLRELSTEIDMHYEDEDFFALAPTVKVISEAVAFLKKAEQPIPTTANHVIERFQRARN